MKVVQIAAALIAVGSTAALAQDAPPPAPFQKASELVPLPDFLPGIGELYVDPSTLPEGPFLAYDREGQLVSTIYMVPLDELGAGHDIENLAALDQPVDHVDIVYNPGHPGVQTPHTHIVLWHVPVDGEAAVAQ